MAGWALVPWTVVALVRTVVFSTPVGFALGASSVTAVAYGGQVLTVPLVAGYSTSRIVEKARQL